MKNTADQISRTVSISRALGLFLMVLGINLPSIRAADEPTPSAVAPAATPSTDSTPTEVALAAADAAPAAPVHQLDRGDNAWMLTSCALVLVMAAPGLA